MLVSTSLIVLVITVYLCFNIKNKYACVIAAYFYSIALMMFTTALVLSRLTNVPYFSTMDYKLFLFIRRFHIAFSLIVRLGNFSVFLFLAISALFARIFLKCRWWVLVLLLLPGAAYFGLNDPAVTFRIFLNVEKELGLSPALVLTILQKFSLAAFCYGMILPILCLSRYYYKTRIDLKRKYALTYLFCVLCLDLYLYVFFVWGTFSATMAFSMDLLRFPVRPIDVGGLKYSMPVSLLAVLITVLCLMVILRPFRTHTVILRQEMIKNTLQMNDSLRELLHSYKNSFVGIEKLCQISLAYLENGQGEQAQDKIQEIRDVSLNSIDRIAHVLDLLRNVAMVYRKVDLEKCMDSALRLLSAESQVKVCRRYDAGDCCVLGDEQHLTEVFVNLIGNALEAMRENPESRPPVLTLILIGESDMIEADVVDNGHGIPKSDIHKIFRPFYTSKQSASDSGIGLSYVKKVITQHHGEIAAKSRPDTQTRFSLYLSAYTERKTIPWIKKN